MYMELVCLLRVLCVYLYVCVCNTQVQRASCQEKEEVGRKQGPPTAGLSTAAPGLQGRWVGGAFRRRRILSLKGGDLQRGALSIFPSTAGRPALTTCQFSVCVHFDHECFLRRS